MLVLSCGCKCSVSFPRVPWVGRVGLLSVFLEFPGQTHMLSLISVFPFWTTRILHGINFLTTLKEDHPRIIPVAFGEAPVSG